MIPLFLFAGSPPLSLPSSPPQRASQPPHGELQADLLQALAEFCDAYEESGLRCAPLNPAYLHAKQILARAV